MTTRRDVLIGAAGSSIAAVVSVSARALAASPTEGIASDTRFPYDYLFVEVPRRNGPVGGPAPFIAHLRSAGAAAVAAAGGEMLGYFTPLIGWSSEQLAVMIRWSRPPSADRERAVAAITGHPSVARVERSRLAPTLRPGPHDRPKTDGIYTHRWFEIRTPDFAEFVQLSGDAWGDFEKEFDAAIFGLFQGRQSADEISRNVTRMLLNTQYANHAIWEASRNPSPRAAKLFGRRSAMTLTTRVVSLHYTSLGRD